MKKLIYTLSAAALLSVAASSVPASAQDLRYAYSNSIDLFGGWAGTPYTVSGDAGKVASIANGADFGLRYTYFFGRHLGIYGQASLAGTSSDTKNFYKTLNKADGNKYSYDPNYSYTQWSEDYLPILTAGLTFRYDFGKCSLRPRVGVGYSLTSGETEGFYTRYNRDDSENPESYHRTLFKQESEDYIISDSSAGAAVIDLPSFVVSASLQLTYTLRTHFYFSAEAGFNYMTAPYELEKVSYDVVNAYDPETWVDAVADSDKIGTVMPDIDNPHSTSSLSRVGSLVYFNVGVGWNIGWNRNERGWYDRKRK